MFYGITDHASPCGSLTDTFGESHEKFLFTLPNVKCGEFVELLRLYFYFSIHLKNDLRHHVMLRLVIG